MWVYVNVRVHVLVCAPLCSYWLSHTFLPCSLYTQGGTENLVEIIALILLPVAILMCAYALVVFIWRAQQIEKKHVRIAVCLGCGVCLGCFDQQQPS